MSETCSVLGCDQPTTRRGLCHGHYSRWYRTGDVDAGRPLQSRHARCTVPDCKQPAVKRGWCRTHYERWRIGGDVRADEPVRRLRDLGPRPGPETAWATRAACTDHPDLPWVADTTLTPKQVRACVAVCLTCPVIDLCAEHAITNSEYGIWGGMTDAQRGATRQARAHARKAAL